MFNLLFLFIFLNSPSNGAPKLEEEHVVVSVDRLQYKVEKFLPRCVKDKTCAMITDTIKAASKEYGFKAKDYNLILALIRKESFGRHIPGRGEWGMLQIVPWEKHIKKLVRYYRCSKKDVLCKCVVKGSRKCVYRRPDVFYVKRGRTYSEVSGTKSSKFFKHNPRAALYVGIGEMAHWRSLYHSSFKYRFWGKWRKPRGRKYPRYPKKYLKTKIHDMYRHCRKNRKEKCEYAKWSDYYESVYPRTERWWYRVTGLLGKNVWVVHHNYGYQIRLDTIGRFYPITVARFLKMLDRLDNKFSKKYGV